MKAEVSSNWSVADSVRYIPVATNPVAGARGVGNAHAFIRAQNRQILFNEETFTRQQKIYYPGRSRLRPVFYCTFICA